MPNIQLLAHMPRFRMEPDQFRFPIGSLVKLTWESYDGLTLGAFSDWQSRYEAADPVFLLVEGEADLPFVRPGTLDGTAMLELKFPSIRWHDLLPRVLGSPFLTGFHDEVVDVVWAALLLAVPGAAPASPRTSVTLLLPEAGHVVHLAAEARTGIKVQGEADQEYVYAADTSCRPVSETDLALASDLVPLVRRLAEDARLLAALRQLMAGTDAGLGPGERLVLAVSALEDLLLPEVRRGQQDAFAERTTRLLGADLEAVARAAYRARSRALHDGPSVAGVHVPASAAEQLLADVLIASATSPDAPQPPDPNRPRGWAPDQRLLPRPPWESGTLSLGVDLTPPEGHTVSWSPLLGLTYDGPPLSLPGGATLTTLSPAEIVSMEDKDIRRDFIAQFQPAELPVAGLAVLAETGDHLGLDDTLMARLLRPRDLAVAGLRMAGLDDFTDPELLGWYAYQGTVRHRRETVLRQTALMRLGHGDDAVPLDPQRLAAARAAWQLLAAYEERGGTDDVDLLLAQFRRAHDGYLEEGTRLTLLFATLEGLLGRFRPAGDDIQLEDLVGVLPGLAAAAAAWFAAGGREVRNTHAHGAWRPSPDQSSAALAALREVSAAALRELFVVWDGGQAPSRALIDHLEARLEERGG